MWPTGTVVALRDVWFDEVWRAVAGIAVEDSPARSVFWMPAGSASAYPVDDAGDEIRMPRGTFRFARRTTKRPMVVVCDPSEPWTIWLHFGDSGFDYWYVNFEHYLGRSEIAYDAIDHKLDLLVRPDGELAWKDEHELEQAGQLGLVDVAAIRRDAERALARPPWPTGWEGYRPDPAWPTPELPSGWDRL